MTVDLNAVNQAVCDTITAALPDARCYPGFRDNVEPPCLIVTGNRSMYVDLDMAVRQGTVFVNLVLIFIAGSDDRAGQEQIMRWLSFGADQPESIVTALAADRTLGGVVDGFRFGASRGVSPMEYPVSAAGRFTAASRFVDAEIDLQIHMTGD